MNALSASSPEFHQGARISLEECPAATEALRELLSLGPRCSREVIAEASAQGFSARQVRRARERLNLVAKRQGNGSAMRTTWALPDPGGGDVPARTAGSAFVPAAAPVAPNVGRPEADRASELYARGDVRAHEAEPAEVVKEANEAPGHAAQGRELARQFPADTTKLERLRAEARLPLLMSRGALAFDEAAPIVIRLLERDRSARQGVVSCAECQCFENSEAHPCPSTPRPPGDISYCPFSRKDTP